MRKTIYAMLIVSAGALNAQNFIISAHRGNSSEAPENTLSAFQSAIDVGADYFECDVRRTEDNVLVTLHDASLNRTTNASGNLSSYTYAELANVDAGYSSEFGSQFAGEKIPTLEEVLLLARGQIKVEIEIKVDGIVDDVVEMVEDLGMVNEVSIIDFDLDRLEEAKSLNPNIDAKYLLGWIYWTRQMNQAQDIGAEYIGPNGVASSYYVGLAADRSLGIISYTINSDGEIIDAMENGNAGIATDVPRRAIELREDFYENARMTTSNTQNAASIFEELIVYPNPVAEGFFISPFIAEKVELSLFNVNGQLVHDYGTINPVEKKQYFIPEGLVGGVYFLEIDGTYIKDKQKIVIE